MVRLTMYMIVGDVFVIDMVMHMFIMGMVVMAMVLLVICIGIVWMMMMGFRTMCMPMRIAMSMGMVVAMAVAMMSVAKCQHADKINDQAGEADRQELAKSLYMYTFCQSFECLVDNFNANEPRSRSAKSPLIFANDLHQENPIGEAGKRVHLPIPIREPHTWRPFAHHSGTKTHY